MHSVAAPLIAVTLLRGTASVIVAVALLVVFVALLVAYFTVRSGAGDPRMRNGSDTLVPPSGPHRYEVTIHSVDGQTSVYTVVTAAGTKKAASVAFDHHGRNSAATGPPSAADEVRDVHVDRRGPVGSGLDGSVQMADGDLFDRSEF